MDSLPVNVTDLAIAAVVVISGLLAFSRGFVHEVLAVGGWIGAIFATIYGFSYAQPLARRLIPLPLGADLAAGAAIFIVSLIVLSVVTGSISRRVRDSAMNALDRALGFVFGLARGAVLVSLAYLGVEWMMPPADQPLWMRGARAMPLVEGGADLLRRLLPEEARRKGAAAADDARERTRQAVETERVVRGIIQPAPKALGSSAQAEGYDRRERRDMERLIDSAQ